MTLPPIVIKFLRFYICALPQAIVRKNQLLSHTQHVSSNTRTFEDVRKRSNPQMPKFRQTGTLDNDESITMQSASSVARTGLMRSPLYSSSPLSQLPGLRKGIVDDTKESMSLRYMTWPPPAPEVKAKRDESAGTTEISSESTAGWASATATHSVPLMRSSGLFIDGLKSLSFDNHNFTDVSNSTTGQQ